jgi:hypothetical protein
MNLTCRQLLAESEPVLSYESPVIGRALPVEFSVGCSARSAGRSFHWWQATWQALQPMQTLVSV